MGVKIREKPKKSGIWWIFVNHHGKRKAKKIGKDKRRAREVAKKIEAKLTLGDLDMDRFNVKSSTFKNYAENWFSLPHERSPRTQKRYKDGLTNHVYPTIGDLRINEVKRKHVKVILDTLRKDLLASTLKNIKAPLNQIFKHAIECEVIYTSPMEGITLKGIKKHPVTPLTEGEAFTLLEKAEDYREGMFYPHLLTLLRTGLRVGELCALKWQDVDFEKRFIKISKTLTGGILSKPKNGKDRKVDMTPHLKETLKALKISKQKKALRQGKPFSEWVFAKKEGKPLTEAMVRNALHRCLDKAGLPKMRTHDLRHTYATIRLLRGHDIGDVSYQLGHSSISITYDVYTHWIPGKFKAQVDDLDTQPNATYTQPDREVLK